MSAAIFRDAERATVAAVFAEPAVFLDASEILNPADFADETLGRAWSAMAALAEIGANVDPLAVVERMGNRAGDKDAIGFVLDLSLKGENATHYARIVKRGAARRRLAATMQQVTTAMEDATAEPTELAEALATAALEIAQPEGGRGYRRLDLWSVMEQIEARTKAVQTGDMPGLPTGYRQIDSQVNGFRPGELVIPAGTAKAGKTAFALNVARHVLLERQARVGIVSAEMSQASLAERMLNAEAMVPVGATGSGRLADEHYPRLAKAAGLLSAADLWVDDEAVPDLATVTVRALGLAQRAGHLDLLIVDYLQLVRHRMRGRRGDEEIAEIANELKRLAGKLQCVVIAPCQLNDKDIARREGKRPTFEDIAGSTGPMRAADFVGLCYRPAMYSPTAPDTFEMQWRSRRTPDFTAYLKWNGAMMRIEDSLYAA